MLLDFKQRVQKSVSENSARLWFRFYLAKIDSEDEKKMLEVNASDA